VIAAPCQRWRERRASYRPAGEPIDPTRYGVELLDREDDAKAFVVQQHYSGSFPAARVRVGLFRSRTFFAPELVGVAVFSVPMSQAVIPRWLGVEPDAGVELGRLVLLDDVPGNGETWFLARAFRLLRAKVPTLEGVVSFSDPLERRTAAGELVKPGHVGVIYQAFGGRYRGRTNRQTILLAPDGRVVSNRALSKVRTGDRGRDYAERELVALGAPRRALHEDGAAWVERCLRQAPWRRFRHPGNHAYVWRLNEALDVYGPDQPYPCAGCGANHVKEAA
jgi:hypothetical protein